VIEKLSHVGILVGDLEKAIPIYKTIMGKGDPVRCDAPELGLRLAYFVGEKGDLLELVETSARTEMKHGDVIVAFEVDDVASEIARLKAQGIKAHYLKPTENMPFERGWITKSDGHGTIVELCPKGAVMDLATRDHAR
jgi:catechol 2,3-dioxygenase-like lactoylglutathione lyase family enzyme